MKKFQTLERNLRAPRTETNLCTFSYLFSEYLQSLKRRHGNDYAASQLKMEKAGFSVGIRLYEVVCLRERTKRENKLIEQLKFIQTVFWKYAFGKIADSLERLKERPNDYLIRDENPLLLRYVTEENGLSPASFIVGMLQGVFTAAGFNCNVSFQFKSDDRGNNYYPHTVFILSFDDQKEI